jgi:serine protease Do
LVESVRDAVVNVMVVSRQPDQGGGDLDEFFQRFFGNRGQGGELPGERGGRGNVEHGLGSGFIVDARGLVVTNNHVVRGATSIRVRLQDGRSFDAKVAGTDPLTDIAVIRLEGGPSDLPTVNLGDSDGLRVGDWVVAIGNPFGLTSSVSTGIISAKARNINLGPYDDFLQTDAAINPGNSGGPLFDLSGRVIGMNTAIVGGGSGIGFAVPSTLIKTLLPQLEKGQKIERGWLGVTVQDLTPALARALGVSMRKGAIVSGVMKGSPGAKAGLQPEDVVTAVNGRPIDSAQALTRIVGFSKPGTSVTLTVQRKGSAKAQEVQVTLGTRPVNPDGQQNGEEEEEPPPQQQKLGMAFRSMTAGLASQLGVPNRGAVITAVQPGSPADQAGLQPGMVVVQAAGKPVQNGRDLSKILSDARSGTTLPLRAETPKGSVLVALEIP